jgi:arylsulfatase A-like enzyme
VLAALAKRPRWNNTVVLVVSDHGEAFLEHGRTEHNSTVFDEMLHVPFILRLPPAFHLPVNPALDQLVTLADIVPTLLATAVIEPDPDLAGINLLRESGGRGSGSRYFVARTTGDSPIYALRSPRWKLMLAGSGQGALFDLERDPGETDDVVFTDRATFYTLGRLLTARVAEPPRFEPIENDQRLTGKDAEMLKKLGYLQ